MSQSITDKKRNLLKRQSDHDEICLSDLTDSLLNLTPDISKLELFDNKSSAARITSQMRRHKVLVDNYYKRLKEVKRQINDK